MKQAALDRSVARATGESMRVVRHMGFSLLVPENHDSKDPRRDVETRLPAHRGGVNGAFRAGRLR